MNAGSFIGRFMAGPVTRFVGIIDLSIATSVVCAILIIGMIWLGTVASVVVLGVLYGLFSGISKWCRASGSVMRSCCDVLACRYRDDVPNAGAYS
jgi:hypothetical protein